MGDCGTVTLLLFPPYSTAVGRSEARVFMPCASMAAPEFFERFCRDYPTTRELFFPSGDARDFPGFTSIFRGGSLIGPKDTVQDGDVLEVVTALSGG
jgi:hypothetical protein